MEWPQNSLLHSPCLEQFLEMSFDRGVHSSRSSGIQKPTFLSDLEEKILHALTKHILRSRGPRKTSGREM